MGQASGFRVRVDVAALYDVADQFDSVAGSVVGLARAQLGFGGAVAGRAHITDGDALRRAFGLLSAELTGWARAADEIGAGLRCGAGRYVESERAAAERVG
jgi:Excreted virulence factor EspC, type VII ESX diderm